MKLQDILFVIVFVFVVLVLPVLPELIYLIFKKKCEKVNTSKYRIFTKIFLGVISGAFVYWIVFMRN